MRENEVHYSYFDTKKSKYVDPTRLSNTYTLYTVYRSIRSGIGKGEGGAMSMYAKLTRLPSVASSCPKLRRDHDDSNTLVMHKTQNSPPPPHPSSPPCRTFRNTDLRSTDYGDGTETETGSGRWRVERLITDLL